MARLSDPITILKGIGEARAKQFANLNIVTLEDLICHFPRAYEDRTAWSKKMFYNIAGAGYFSSDRTIAQYNHDIWKL